MGKLKMLTHCILFSGGGFVLIHPCSFAQFFETNSQHLNNSCLGLGNQSTYNLIKWPVYAELETHDIDPISSMPWTNEQSDPEHWLLISYWTQVAQEGELA